jgi:hypothetical protein
MAETALAGAGASSTIFTLPAFYRPEYDQYLPAHNSPALAGGESVGVVIVDASSGDVQLYEGAPAAGWARRLDVTPWYAAGLL